MRPDFLAVDDAVGVDEDDGVDGGVVHRFAVEADEVEEGGDVGSRGGVGVKDHARPEGGVGVTGGYEGVGGGGCAVGVLQGDEAGGGSGGGVDEREAGEGKVRVVG